MHRYVSIHRWWCLTEHRYRYAYVDIVLRARVYIYIYTYIYIYICDCMMFGSASFYLEVCIEYQVVAVQVRCGHAAKTNQDHHFPPCYRDPWDQRSWAWLNNGDLPCVILCFAIKRILSTNYPHSCPAAFLACCCLTSSQIGCIHV